MDESKRHDAFVAIIRRIRQLHTDAADLTAHCEGAGAPDDIVQALRAVESRLRKLRDR